jgi:hypothetical protein
VACAVFGPVLVTRRCRSARSATRWGRRQARTRPHAWSGRAANARSRFRTARRDGRACAGGDGWRSPQARKALTPKALAPSTRPLVHRRLSLDRGCSNRRIDSEPRTATDRNRRQLADNSLDGGARPWGRYPGCREGRAAGDGCGHPLAYCPRSDQPWAHPSHRRSVKRPKEKHIRISHPPM